MDRQQGRVEIRRWLYTAACTYTTIQRHWWGGRCLHLLFRRLPLGPEAISTEAHLAIWSLGRCGPENALEVALIALLFSICSHPHKQNRACLKHPDTELECRTEQEGLAERTEQGFLGATRPVRRIVLCGFDSPSHTNWRAFKKAMGGELSQRWQDACRGGHGERGCCTPPSSLARDSWRCVTCRPAALLRAVCRRRWLSMVVVAQPVGRQMAASTWARCCRFRHSRLLFLPG